MENKNVRPNGQPSEVKPTKSDLSSATGPKLQNRSVKKRENVLPKTPSAAVSTGSKNPKPWLSKQKGPDKRQQRNDGFAGAGVERKNYHQVNDGSNDPDLDLVLSETGRKQNLTHLLNMKFQFAPRDTPVSNYWRATHSGHMGGKSKRFNQYPARSYLNKDHYLQANCQFVVKADGDYTVYLADPDLLVPWETIEQIRIWGSEVGSCPICLHPPVAAKMTRCGHMYCWPCILHFLALSDKPSRPCPICDVCVRIQDLKSVVALEQRNLKIGDVLEMRLMKRERHSLQPQLVSGCKGFDAVSNQPKPNYLGKVGEDHVFSKLLLCTPEEVGSLILQWERHELQTRLKTEKDCPESCFIHQALELLQVRENITAIQCLSSFATALDLATSKVGEFSGSDISHLTSLNENNGCDSITELQIDGKKEDPTHQSDILSLESNVPPVPGFSIGSPEITPVVDANRGQQKNVFYFYQSSDGQAVYLHHVNVQILVRCFGSLELCPETIQGRIVEIETLSMTEDLRNRFRYLGHIPISKQFHITEIALTELEIHPTIVEEFRECVENRARRRRLKDRDERRRDLEIQRVEDAKWGRTRNQPIASIDSQVHFPGFSSSPQDVSTPVEDTFIDVSPSSIELGVQHGVGLSFAQMLREGKNKVPNAWSSLSTPGSRAVEKKCNLDRSGRYRNTSESGSETADYAPAPEYKETFSSALAAAFDQAAKSKSGVNTEEKLNNSSVRKNRKMRQKVLFSTGMNFM